MYENKILNIARDSVLKYEDENDRQVFLEIFALMFDGLMIYGDHYNNNHLLEYITNCVDDEFEGLNMKWAFKPHDKTIQMPDDYEIPQKIIAALPTINTSDPIVSQFNNETRTFDESYEYMKSEFEKTHCKIINCNMFCQER